MIEGISRYFRQLYQDTGLNFVVFYDDYEFTRFLGGALMSLQLILVVSRKWWKLDGGVISG